VLLQYDIACGELARALALAVKPNENTLNVLDLGCSTGAASGATLRALPDVTLKVTLVEENADKIERVKKEYGTLVKASYRLPFESSVLWELLSPQKFDVIVSVYAMHRLSALSHLDMYKRLSSILTASGLIAVLDIYRLSGFQREIVKRAYEDKQDCSSSRADEQGNSGSINDHYYPVRVRDQISWWQQVGLEATVSWQGLESSIVLARIPPVITDRARDAALMSSIAATAPPVYGSVLEAVGATPLVRLDRLCKKLNIAGTILAKLEFYNPGLSKKDRIALAMVQAARNNGSLLPGQTVIELTSGSTGTGLAIACAVLGHPFIAVMSSGNSRERAQMMSALGAEVILVPQNPTSLPGQVSKEDLALVELCTKTLQEEKGAFRADQFRLPESVAAHEFGTGVELWEQCGGEVDAFVDFIGSSSTFTGIARALKSRKPEICCIALEPAGAPVLAGKPITNTRHRIQGGGYAMSLPLFDREVCDGFLTIRDSKAIEVAHLLARTEGILAGFSSGANVAAALELLGSRFLGGTVACVICDSGAKYLSTDLFDTQ
jgi:cysteine synthase A